LEVVVVGKIVRREKRNEASAKRTEASAKRTEAEYKETAPEGSLTLSCCLFVLEPISPEVLGVEVVHTTPHPLTRAGISGSMTTVDRSRSFHASSSRSSRSSAFSMALSTVNRGGAKQGILHDVPLMVRAAATSHVLIGELTG
jgi:hypothetical protein